MKPKFSYFHLKIPSSIWLATFAILSSLIFATISSSFQDTPAKEEEEGEHGETRQQIEFRASEALELIHDWTLRFGGEVYRGTQETTCHRAIHDQFDPARVDSGRRGAHQAQVASIDWTRLHADIVRTISNSMGWHREAVEAIVRASEAFSGNHSFDEKLRVDYVDVHRLYDIDELKEVEQPPPSGYSPADSSTDPPPSEGLPEGLGESSPSPSSSSPSTSDSVAVDPIDEPAEPLATPAPLVMQAPGTPMPDAEGEWQAPLRYLKLSRHANFGDVPISTETSAVHVPVHIYPADPAVMNSIAWSEELTRVFRNNFVRNPKLTNQYFASPLGFMRLFPAQKWQIPRTDPDLYDARMRPWYVAGASSRKDVIILIDSSGSMTGSRRDIAKGVTFEILDTLTDNDNFLILKFSDVIQQVGVPSCPEMRVQRQSWQSSSIPLKNTLVGGIASISQTKQQQQQQQQQQQSPVDGNVTDLESLYLLPATGRNVRYVKTNFTIATSGIANFSNALMTAFEVLKKYENLGSQCNQAIMLITDGSPSDFEDIFNHYNYPNAPVRLFSYLIGREAGDGTHTKMMACHNRGFYTHVINLAEVRETVQQYIPVMARPLVLNRTHPITWTPAYGELTYQTLTDWIWESRRRERARAVLSAGSAGGRITISQSGGVDIRVSSSSSSSSSDTGGEPEDQLSDQEISAAASDSSQLESELEALDIFGYNSNPDCFWETRRNDLLTTVVQPVYDQRNESQVVEKFLNKNTWIKKESIMRTANLLGIAAADMKINDIIGLAPSHKLGSNGYAVMLTNNGLVMHHPDLRSVLEPFSNEPSDRQARILKPFFSSLDFTQVEHNLADSDAQLLAMRREAVEGKTGWRELLTKRTLDCQRRVQSRKQIFYYKPLEQFPFSFLIAIPQPYGSHRVEAQVEIKNSTLPERLTTYFTTSDYDLWSVHPDYQYCDGPSNNTITTLLDMFQRIEEGKLDDIQWRPAESSKPPVFSPDKIICDKNLVQSLVYDAVATFSFSDNCGPPSLSAESQLVSMFGVRFSFVATRSGLTRVRHYNTDDFSMKKEALAFAKKHARASDETYYSRTVDYNMLINDTATLIQVPFNTHLKIADRFRKIEMEQITLAAANYDSNLESNSNNNNNNNADIRSIRLNFKEMNLFEKLELLTNNSLYVIATQSIISKEGTQRAVAGVVGVFYDYASFALRLLNTTNYSSRKTAEQFKKPAHCYLPPDNLQQSAGSSRPECDESRTQVKCGHLNDTIDCLLIDNNGYIILSEDLNFVGRHLRAYDTAMMARLVSSGVFHEINVTDYQSICVRQEQKQGSSSGAAGNSLISYTQSFRITQNLLIGATHLWTLMLTIGATLIDLATATHQGQASSMQQLQQPISSLLPNKTYLRPCDRILTRYETRPGLGPVSSELPEYYTTAKCNCPAWFVYEQVPKTNLIMIITDTSSACQSKCEASGHNSIDLAAAPVVMAATAIDSPQVDDSLNTQYNVIGSDEQKVCSMFERESKLHKKRLDTCLSHHPEEEHIKLCGSASKSAGPQWALVTLAVLFACWLNGIFTTSRREWM